MGEGRAVRCKRGRTRRTAKHCKTAGKCRITPKGKRTPVDRKGTAKDAADAARKQARKLHRIVDGQAAQATHPRTSGN
eukprot:3493604-Pyramimonas_sp.AAC.1